MKRAAETLILEAEKKQRLDSAVKKALESNGKDNNKENSASTEDSNNIINKNYISFK